jgi:uncharacterized protein
MTENKRTVAEYMDAFSITDHTRILACLTENVIWEMPGFYYHEGKEAFDKEIENDAFEGRPTIHVIRLIEENNIVVAEGTVQCKIKNGGLLDAVFCDVFHMEKGKIQKLTSYVMDKSAGKK